MSIKKLINAYEPKTHEHELSENLKVIYVETGFDSSFNKAKDLLK